VALLQEARRVTEVAFGVVECMVGSTTSWAEHAWLTGDRDGLPALLHPVMEQAVVHGEPWWIGEVGFWLWRVGALGEPPAAMAEPYALLVSGRWREAHEAWEAIGCPYEAAQALSCGGDEAALRLALERFDDLGARGERDDAARQLRRLGVRDIPRSRRAGRASSDARLSRREAEVLALVDEGLRNADIAAKLFLSERTVEHHVASLLRKLDAHSRVDAVRRARDLGLWSAPERSGHG
jgi:DNA-binding CsgD family transcriptional regulator